MIDTMDWYPISEYLKRLIAKVVREVEKERIDGYRSQKKEDL